MSELVALTIRDIDCARMVINIREAKGGKDRYVMLSDQLLAIVRDYWRRTKPNYWLFPGPDPLQPITARTLQQACRDAAEAARLDKSVTVHTLRHSFATHVFSCLISPGKAFFLAPNYSISCQVCPMQKRRVIRPVGRHELDEIAAELTARRGGAS